MVGTGLASPSSTLTSRSGQVEPACRESDAYEAWKSSRCDGVIFDTDRFLDSPMFRVAEVRLGEQFAVIVQVVGGREAGAARRRRARGCRVGRFKLVGILWADLNLSFSPHDSLLNALDYSPIFASTTPFKHRQVENSERLIFSHKSQPKMPQSLAAFRGKTPFGFPVPAAAETGLKVRDTIPYGLSLTSFSLAIGRNPRRSPVPHSRRSCAKTFSGEAPLFGPSEGPAGVMCSDFVEIQIRPSERMIPNPRLAAQALGVLRLRQIVGGSGSRADRKRPAFGSRNAQAIAPKRDRIHGSSEALRHDFVRQFTQQLFFLRHPKLAHNAASIQDA